MMVTCGRTRGLNAYKWDWGTDRVSSMKLVRKEYSNKNYDCAADDEDNTTKWCDKQRQ